MRVLIIGAGALGKALAGLFARREDVMVYDHNPEIHQWVSRKGIQCQRGGNKRNLKVRSLESLDEVDGNEIDVLIFATKVMDLKSAAALASAIRPRCVFLPQNGLFDFGWMLRFFKTASVCRGVTTMACQQTTPGEVKLFYEGNFYIGSCKSPAMTSLFQHSGIGVKVYQDFDRPVWAKLIFSAVMNPLPIITGRGYDILRNQKTWALVQQAVGEGRAVAKALGVRLAFDPLRLIQRVHKGDLAGISHKGSTFQDISVGRPTELDFMTGALLKQAKKLKIAAPALKKIYVSAKSVGA